MFVRINQFDFFYSRDVNGNIFQLPELPGTFHGQVKRRASAHRQERKGKNRFFYHGSTYKFFVFISEYKIIEDECQEVNYFSGIFLLISPKWPFGGYAIFIIAGEIS
jgi:hypothetical protein